MSFDVDWTFPALAAFNRIPYPQSADVARVVYRFAARQEEGTRNVAVVLRGAGYWFRVRVDERARTVVVLWLEPTRQ
jgi:hypothetical protein